MEQLIAIYVIGNVQFLYIYSLQITINGYGSNVTILSTLKSITKWRFKKLLQNISQIKTIKHKKLAIYVIGNVQFPYSYSLQITINQYGLNITILSSMNSTTKWRFKKLLQNISQIKL